MGYVYFPVLTDMQHGRRVVRQPRLTAKGEIVMKQKKREAFVQVDMKHVMMFS